MTARSKLLQAARQGASDAANLARNLGIALSGLALKAARDIVPRIAALPAGTRHAMAARLAAVFLLAVLLQPSAEPLCLHVDGVRCLGPLPEASRGLVVRQLRTLADGLEATPPGTEMSGLASRHREALALRGLAQNIADERVETSVGVARLDAISHRPLPGPWRGRDSAILAVLLALTLALASSRQPRVAAWTMAAAGLIAGLRVMGTTWSEPLAILQLAAVGAVATWWPALVWLTGRGRPQVPIPARAIRFGRGRPATATPLRPVDFTGSHRMALALASAAPAGHGPLWLRWPALGWVAALARFLPSRAPTPSQILVDAAAASSTFDLLLVEADDLSPQEFALINEALHAATRAGATVAIDIDRHRWVKRQGADGGLRSDPGLEPSVTFPT